MGHLQNPVTRPLKPASRLPKPMFHHTLTKSHTCLIIMHTKNNVCLPIIDLEVVALVPVAAVVGAAVGAEPVIIEIKTASYNKDNYYSNVLTFGRLLLW